MDVLIAVKERKIMGVLSVILFMIAVKEKNLYIVLDISFSRFVHFAIGLVTTTQSFSTVLGYNIFQDCLHLHFSMSIVSAIKHKLLPYYIIHVGFRFSVFTSDFGDPLLYHF